MRLKAAIEKDVESRQKGIKQTWPNAPEFPGEQYQLAALLDYLEARESRIVQELTTSMQHERMCYAIADSTEEAQEHKRSADLLDTLIRIFREGSQ